jgi:hypothetical protein
MRTGNTANGFVNIFWYIREIEPWSCGTVFFFPYVFFYVKWFVFKFVLFLAMFDYKV